MADATPNRGPSLFNTPGMAGKRRMLAIEPRPEVDALIRKLIADVETAGSTMEIRSREGRVNVPDPAYLRQVSSTIAQDTTDATSLMQLLPDISLVEQLQVSSILAPKDFVSSELTFAVDRAQFHLPIAGLMLEKIKDFFTSTYDLKKWCPKMLSDSLFKTGSYAIMIIPENSVDALINGSQAYSMESFQAAISPLMDGSKYRPLHLLGNGASVTVKEKAKEGETTTTVATVEAMTDAMESMAYSGAHRVKAYDPYVSVLGEFAKSVIVTDNFNVMKAPAVAEARRHTLVQQSIGLEMGNGNYSLGGPQRRISLGRSAIAQAVKTKEMLVRPMVGHPLIMHLPSESVVPVFITPEKHLGYFILLDAEGHPITLANRRDIYNDLSTQNNGTGSSTQGASQMIQMAQNLSMGVDPSSPMDPRQMVRIYGQLLEHDLKARLNAGLYGKNLTIRMTEDVYATMLARSFKRQQTQILYVPNELLTYIAFDYDERGFGRSLTEKGKIIGSMRAMLMFAQLMGAIKNSVARQRVNITLSENDIDPSKTLARVMDEYTRRRNVTMPFVASDPADMISYLNMAGVEFTMEGKGLPSHKVDVEDKQSNRTQINAELDTMLRDRHYQNYLVTPETVQASTGADFAANVLLNNQLTAKRVISMQDDFTPQLEDLVRKISTNDAILLNQLRDVVRNALKMLKRQAQEKKDILERAKGLGGGSELGGSSDLLGSPAGSDTSPDSAVDQGLGNAPAPAPAGPQLPKTTSDLPEYQIQQLPQPLVRDKGQANPAPEMTEDQEVQYIEEIVFAFLDAVQIKLPRPNTSSLTTLTADFEAYKDAVDKKLEFMLDPSIFTEANMGQYAGRVDELKAAIRAHYMRQWCQNEGYLTELDEITSVDEDGKPEFDLLQSVSSHANLIASSIQSYMDKIGLLKETIAVGNDVLTKTYPEAHLDQAAPGGMGGDMGGMGGGDMSGGMGNGFGAPGGDLGGDAGLGDGLGSDDALGGEMGAGAGPNGELSLDENTGTAETSPENPEGGLPPGEEEEEAEDEETPPPPQKP